MMSLGTTTQKEEIIVTGPEGLQATALKPRQRHRVRAAYDCDRSATLPQDIAKDHIGLDTVAFALDRRPSSRHRCEGYRQGRILSIKRVVFPQHIEKTTGFSPYLN